VSTSPIEHVVVLMMENHSYDHMFGYFPPPIGTLASTPQCLPNPDTSNPNPPLSPGRPGWATTQAYPAPL
jgi:phospholipase C